MELTEINKILSDLSDWYNNFDFNSLTDDEKKRIITNKFLELGVFNINTEIIDELGYEESEVLPQVRDISEKIPQIVADSITVEEKINQILNNPNYIKFAVDCGVSDDLLDVLINSNYFCNNAIKTLEIIRDILKYGIKHEIYMDINKIEVLFSKIEIKENEFQQTDKILKEIAKLSSYGNTALKVLNYREIKALTPIISSDDVKIEVIIDMIENGMYNDEVLVELIEFINEFDKKIDLCRKLVDCQKKTNIKYLKTYILGGIFSESLEVKKIEDFQFLKNKLKDLLEDELLSEYVDSYTLANFFKAFKDDHLLLLAYNEIIRDSSLSKFVNHIVILSFVKNIEDDRLKIRVMNQMIKAKNLSNEDVEEILKKNITDKSVFFDKQLMEPIYTDSKFDITIAKLLNKRIKPTALESFKNDEIVFIKNGKLDVLLEKYKNLGLVDEETLNKIYEISCKSIKNLTMEEMIKRISNNFNTKEIVEHIATNVKRYNDDYLFELEKFENIFPKTRFGSLPDFSSYQKMNLDMCKKFNLKTWNQLIKNPLFNQDDNTKRALVEIIAISGLFENDSNVELRKRQIINLFENYNIPISKEEMDLLDIKDLEWISSHFDTTNITTYKLRDGITIPDDLSNWLLETLTFEQMSRLKKETGNIGSMLTKYLSPYVYTENKWKLRNGIQIDLYSDYLKSEMTKEEYEKLLTSSDTPKEIINFINPYEEIKNKGFVIKQNLNESKRNEVIELILSSNLNNRYNYENLHRIFDGLDLSFNEDFYKFFLENQDQILLNNQNQSQLKDIKKKFDLIKKYYSSRGNYNPNYNDMLRYLREIPYTITFGNEEFAKDAKNTDVSDEGYAFYEGLLNETRQRKLTTVPRHEKIYEYVAADGVKYQVMAKVLRADDPFNLLVGESKFTNCCQRYNSTGENCMKHASTSQNGGIFATYLINDGIPTMLTQSWFWTNEAKACLDNVEATKLITETNGDRKKILQDIATFAIKSSCEDMIKNSREAMNTYISEKTRKIVNSSLTEDEKQIELNKLEMIRQRQTLKIITVGEGCDDLRVRESFTQIEDNDNSYGPKGYIGYRDSGKDQQHIIIKTDEKILPIDPEYIDVPIFRDERQINIEKSDEIRYETLRKITDIESIAHKPQMRQYIDKTGQYTIKDPELLANLYGCFLHDLKVITGEDWYYVYSDNDRGIEVYDLAKKEPRLSDEGMKQTLEMTQAFEKILSDSIVLDNSGNITFIKPITADLREDTSYLLYLLQMKRGIIEQIGEDVAYFYEDDSKKTTITSEQQQNILLNSKEIRNNQNPNMIMHKVSFKPSEKEIKKLLSEKLQNNIGGLNNVK